MLVTVSFCVHSPGSDGWTTVTLCISLAKSQFRIGVLSSPIPFPSCPVALVKAISPFGEEWERLTVYIFGSEVESFFKGTQPPFHSNGSGSGNRLKPKN